MVFVVVGRGDLLQHGLELEVRAQTEHEQGRALRLNLGRNAAVALRADEHRQLVVPPSEVQLVNLLLVARDAGVVGYIVEDDEGIRQLLILSLLA